jgi:hypothetical protein
MAPETLVILNQLAMLISRAYFINDNNNNLHLRAIEKLYCHVLCGTRDENNGFWIG